jgi:hypothetical protein
MSDYIDRDKAIFYLRRAATWSVSQGAWVPLAQLRDSVDIVREQIDEILTDLYLAGTIGLIAEVNRKALTAADHEAALHVGGEDKHLIRWRAA